jgi:hypothetical protein
MQCIYNTIPCILCMCIGIAVHPCFSRRPWTWSRSLGHVRNGLLLPFPVNTFLPFVLWLWTLGSTSKWLFSLLQQALTFLQSFSFMYGNVPWLVFIIHSGVLTSWSYVGNVGSRYVAGWPDEFGKSIAQNVAQPIFWSKLKHYFYRGEEYLKIWAFCIF